MNIGWFILYFVAVLLLGPPLLVLGWYFMQWWLDHTVGRLMDWLEQ